MSAPFVGCPWSRTSSAVVVTPRRGWPEGTLRRTTPGHGQGRLPRLPTRAVQTERHGRRDAAARESLPALFPTTLVGSFAQPDWLIDRERLAARFPPRVTGARAVASRPRPPRGGAGRRDPRGDPRPGAGRAGHRHRRRDPPGELLQPLRDRARRHRHRQPGCRAGPQRSPEPRAADRRPDQPAPSRSRSATREFLRASTDRAIKVTVPGPFTMSQQAQNEFYPDLEPRRRWPTPTPATRRSRTCSRRGPTSCRSTSPTCRPGPTPPGSTA